MQFTFKDMERARLRTTILILTLELLVLINNASGRNETEHIPSQHNKVQNRVLKVSSQKTSKRHIMSQFCLGYDWISERAPQNSCQNISFAYRRE